MPLKAVLAGVEARLDRFFDTESARAARHSAEFQALWREMRAAAAGGKRVRPRLLVITGYHLGGDIPTDQLIELATIIELLHTALIVHDDVIDGDIERRGAPNLIGAFAAAARRDGLGEDAAARWSQNAAILAGDLLLTAAVRLTATLHIDADRRRRLVELLDESIYRAAAGELADISYAAGLGSPTAADIRDMMADKTAHYSVELPLRAAAILVGASTETEAQLAAIGQSLGIVFQMRDDLLGVFGAATETGKSTKNDLREGKHTMLVALAKGSEAWEQAAPWFGHAELDDSGAQRLRDALELSGARTSFEAAMRHERDVALGVIRSAPLPPRLADLLAAEAEFAAERRA